MQRRNKHMSLLVRTASLRSHEHPGRFAFKSSLETALRVENCE